MKLYLASSSPRRRELMGYTGIPFEVKVSDAEEIETGEPDVLVRENARLKGQAVSRMHPEDVVLSADTLVYLPDEKLVLGKPRDKEDAVRMLKMMQGRWHEVYTGVCVRMGDREETRVDVASVLFDPLSEEAIRTYVESALKNTSYETQPKMVTMLIDLLNYGAAAQVNFNRRTDELVNAGFEAYQQYATKELAAELTDVKETIPNDRSITAVTKMGFSINLADRTEINAKMTMAEGYTMEDISKVEVLNADGEVVDTITEFKLLVDDNNRVQLTFSGVKSVNMRDMFYFVVYVGDQTASDTYGYSIEASAKTTIASSTGSSADMILACMYYGDSAAAYFGK